MGTGRNWFIFFSQFLVPFPTAGLNNESNGSENKHLYYSVILMKPLFIFLREAWGVKVSS
jgi:hypothetical protein